MENLLSGFMHKLEQGVVGLFMKTADPAFVEIAGYAGFDFAILDLEHGPNSVYQIQNLVRAAELAGIAPIVRVPHICDATISSVIDVGALGIQVPQVETAEDVVKVIRAARFYPQGNKGVCRFVRAAKYSALDREVYFNEVNQLPVICHLEGAAALEHIDEILSVAGLSVIFIGPYDLSQSLGVPGRIKDPRVQAAMQAVVEKAHQYNVKVGTFVDDLESLEFWRRRGVKYLAYSVDVGIFSNACRKIVDFFAGANCWDQGGLPAERS